MQTFKFVSKSRGKSKAGNDYDITVVSDGISEFPPFQNAAGIYDQLQEMGLQRGDDFTADIQLAATFRGIEATIVRVEL